MQEIFGIHSIPQVVHADRGTSMASKTVAALLSDLEVTQSHSRPWVSNDNPYPESLFKSLKYTPVFPERFASLTDARAFMSEFVDWYNHHHQHSSVGFHTPADVHYGLAAAVADKRSQTLAAARARHPHRFTTTTDPKILALPETVRVERAVPLHGDQPHPHPAYCISDVVVRCTSGGDGLRILRCPGWLFRGVAGWRVCAQSHRDAYRPR